MVPEALDKIFPFVVFGYGFVITGVLNSPLSDLAETRLPARMATQLRAHRGLALVSLVIGALWSLQTLWLGA